MATIGDFDALFARRDQEFDVAKTIVDIIWNFWRVFHRVIFYVLPAENDQTIYTLIPWKFAWWKSIILNFVVTPRNFIIAKLSIRKPGSSSVLIKSV